MLELLERVTVLHKHLEAKESQAEMDMDQVRAAHLRPPSCECVLSGRAHTGGVTGLERTGEGCYGSGGLQRPNHSQWHDPAAYT